MHSTHTYRLSKRNKTRFFSSLGIRLLWLFPLLIAGKCEDEHPPDLLPDVEVNYIVNMNLPLYQDLLIPGGYANTPSNIGVQGIIIYNFNNQYKAFDRACPHLSPGSCAQMEFDGTFYLVCPCDNAEFSIYDGSAQNENISQRAREYHVQNLGDNRLKITNYY